MGATWLDRAVVYSVDIASFADGNGDGIGDLAGLAAKLDHVAQLGATCLWLQPFYVSPHRDDGYDVADHLAVDASMGSASDVEDLIAAAHDRGLRVILDLVLNHTSTDHAWFRAARRDPRSPMRDRYIFRPEPDTTVEVEPIFPGASDAVWHHDPEAAAWYLARFYPHEPDLATGNEAVLAEAEAIMQHWARLGADGFRLDALPYIVQKASWVDPTDDGRWVLERLHDAAVGCAGEVVLVGEADVEPQQYDELLGDGRCDGLFDFHLNNQLFLALARGDARPLRGTLAARRTAPRGRLLHWVRNHDELDLERLSPEERDEVYAAFAPDVDARIYGRGIRRRYPPMVDGDRGRIELAYSIVWSLPGVPVLHYGEEIGMGDDLDEPERMAVRGAMQWTEERPSAWRRPVVRDQAFAPDRVNVAAQERDESSLLAWFTALDARRRSLPVCATGWPEVLHEQPDPVLALRYDGLLVAHNLGPVPCDVRLPDGVWSPVDGGAMLDGNLRIPAHGSLWLSSHARTEVSSAPA